MSKLEASKNAKESAEKAKTDEENVFRLMDVDFSIPRGQLVAIVGAVGSGKTSLLQGVIGEMRRTSGSITFGGSVAYSSQSAWIQVNCFFLIYIIAFELICFRVTRTPQSVRMSVLAAHLRRRGTGTPFVIHALSPISMRYLMVISQKLAKGLYLFCLSWPFLTSTFLLGYLIIRGPKTARKYLPCHLLQH
jgi:ABC-type dipeptide/oligopeptide/nickel transport system ATPase component